MRNKRAGSEYSCMSTSIKNNYMWNLMLRITGIAFPLITYPYVSRVLNPDGLGRVVFAESFVAYLVLLTQMGIPAYGIRECSVYRDDKEKLSRTVHELIMINLVMGLLSYIILTVCIIGVPKMAGDKAVFYIMSGQIVAAAFDVGWLYEGLERYRYIAVRTMAVRLAVLILMFIIVRYSEQYLLYAVLLVLMNTVPAILNIICAGRHITYRSVGGYHPLRHIRAVITFFAIAGMNAVYTNLDKVMLGFIYGDRQVGYYSVGVKVRQVLFLCVTSLSAVLLPRAAYYKQNGYTAEYAGLNRRAMHYMAVTVIPLAVLFTIVPYEVVMLLAGEEFGQAVMPMRILMPGLVMSAFNYAYASQVLIPCGKEKINLWIHTAGALLNAVINALLIPVWDTAGAAAGSLIAETAVMVMLAHVSGEQIRIRDMGLIKVIISAAIAAVLVVVTGVVTGYEGLNYISLLIIKVIVFSFTYTAVLCCLGEELTTELIHRIRLHCRRG